MSETWHYHKLRLSHYFGVEVNKIVLTDSTSSYCDVLIAKMLFVLKASLNSGIFAKFD